MPTLRIPFPTSAPVPEVMIETPTPPAFVPDPEPRKLPELSGFHGTGDKYRHWTKRILWTDGVNHLAEQAGAFWLIDAIASHQTRKVLSACQGFQVWTLTPSPTKKNGAMLRVQRDSGAPVITRQFIEYTDFPFENGEPFKLYVAQGDDGQTLMLPSEY